MFKQLITQSCSTKGVAAMAVAMAEVALAGFAPHIAAERRDGAAWRIFHGIAQRTGALGRPLDDLAGRIVISDRANFSLACDVGNLLRYVHIGAK